MPALYRQAIQNEQHHRLLVADDDPNLLELMSANLEDDKTQVVCAKNGVEAQELLAKEDFDFGYYRSWYAGVGRVRAHITFAQ